MGGPGRCVSCSLATLSVDHRQPEEEPLDVMPVDDRTVRDAAARRRVPLLFAVPKTPLADRPRLASEPLPEVSDPDAHDLGELAVRVAQPARRFRQPWRRVRGLGTIPPFRATLTFLATLHGHAMGISMTPPSAAPTNGPRTLERGELWTLYQIAIDDRNFQVNLTWDRTKHYFLFNVGVFSVAGGIERIGQGSSLVVLGLLGVAALNSFFAAASIWKGHAYYRKVSQRMTRIERALGLAGTTLEESPFAISTTRGKVRDITGKEGRSLSDFFTIVNLSIVLQVVIGFASGIVFVHLLR